MTYKCPECGSTDVSVAFDARIYYIQVEGELHHDGTTEYDEMEEATCRTCNYGESDPGRSWEVME